VAGTLTIGPSRRAMVTVSVGAVGVSVVSVLPMFLTAGLAVQIGDDLGFSASRLGTAPAAFFGAMVLTSPFAGRLVDALGAVRAIRGVGIAVAVLLMLIAATARSFPALLGFLALAGIANALAQPATNQLVAHRIPRVRQGFAFGAKYSAIPIASMLAGLAVPVLGLTVGWRWAFAFFAVAALLAAVWPFGPAPAGPSRSELAGALDVRLPQRLLLLLAVGVGMAAASGSSMAIFTVAGAVDSGWSEGDAGLIFAAASLAGVATRLVAGVRADRRGRNYLRGVAVMLAAGALGVLLLAFGSPVLFAAGAPLAFGAGWGWPGLFILAVVTLNRSAPAAATSLTQTGTSAGCVLGPLGFGLLVGHTSYTVAWLANGAVLLLAAGVILLGRRQVLRHLGDTRPPDRRRLTVNSTTTERSTR
jgi:MFS family permease